MKQVRLKRLHLLNFKGISSLELEFRDDVTRIYGANGVGKTTIFDAFVWVLFGKDSQDRKQFDIKTLDENGVAIPRIPHEVTAVLDVDGETIELKRTYNEKWTKKRGSLEEEFTGHEEERFYNGVPCSVKEYEMKTASICPENIFKFITNPRYFSSQKENVQRQMLIEMAGGISNEEVANGNAAFEELLRELTGKSMTEYKKQIEAQRTRIKGEADGMPARIDERKRDIAALEALDYEGAEKAIAEGEARIADIDAQMADKTKLDESIASQKAGMLKQITDLRVKAENVKRRIIADTSEKYNSWSREKARLEDEKAEKQRGLASKEKEVVLLQNSVAATDAQLASLRDEFRKVAASKLEFNEADFTCPTCGRRYEVEEIEGKQEQMTARFNEDKARRLAEMSARGTKLNEDKTRALATIDDLTVDCQVLKGEIGNLDETIGSMKSVPEGVDSYKLINESTDLRAIDEKINAIEAQIKEIAAPTITDTDTAALKVEKAEVGATVAYARELLGKRGEIARHEARIGELTEAYRKLQQELAGMEKKLYTIAEFGKAKVRMVEDSINGLFRFVKFKMFDTQVNGAVVETCEATINGVPYSSANNAAQIQAGLDIIDAICRHQGITAPIFSDNAEGVNAFPEMDSQMVLLYVSEDKSLTIK